MRYKTEKSCCPADEFKKFKTFGPANARSPAQHAAALLYTQTTIQSYKIDLPATSLLIFTDGSSNPDHIGGGGIGAVAYRPDNQKVWSFNRSTPKIITSYSTELAAIEHSLQFVLDIITREPDYTSDIVIFCDCQAAVYTARQPLLYDPERRPDYWTSRHRIKTIKTKLRQAGISVTIEWIPGHTSLPQNDEADRLAKLASTRSSLQPLAETQIPTPLSATNFHINTRSLQISNATILASQSKAKTMFRHTGGSLPPDNSSIYIDTKISRSFQVTIDRLTIGDHLFNNRISHLDPSIPPTCDHCPLRDGISHRLLICHHYDAQRIILRQKIRRIPHLRRANLSLDILLGHKHIRNSQQRNFLIRSLTDFLKATNLVIPKRLNGPNTNPHPPH
jgi:ribonuclease HI